MLASDFHTLFNHFTIALINVGIIFELVAFMFKNDGMKRYSWISIRLGFAFGLVSLATGFFSESSIAIKAEAVRVLSYHELLSIALMVVLGIAVLLRVLMQDRFDNTESGALLRGGYLVLIVATIFLTGVSGFLGMQMVYSYGVNVKPYERILEALPPTVTTPQPTFGAPTQGTSTPGAQTLGADSMRAH
jgi:uncharacterized membrane protein